MFIPLIPKDYLYIFKKKSLHTTMPTGIFQIENEFLLTVTIFE